MIKALPLEENPREKALINGIESLNNVELLALVLRTGTKEESVIQLSQRLLRDIGGFSQLMNMNYASLIQIKGIKQAKAITLLSIIEIGKRLKNENKEYVIISSPEDIYEYMKNEMMFLKQEHFVVLCLDNKNKVIKKKTLFIGSINTSVVTPREVFKEAISVSSAKIVLCHNHPSGDSCPSQEDIYITNQFVELGQMMDIQVIDHIIIGWNEYSSIIGKQCFKDEQKIGLF